MSSNSKRSLVERLRRGKKTRARLIESNLAETIAFQIRATRNARGMTQADLAREAGMAQNNIARMESEAYGKHSITSLKRIAEAFDVALDVRFVPYSQYIDWLSGTPYRDEGISPAAFAVPCFEEEDRQRRYETVFQYGGVSVVTPKIHVNDTTLESSVPVQPTIHALHACGSYGSERQVAA